jgi:hypothetical protein
MNPPFLAQLATTGGIAITSLVFAMIWAKICKPVAPLDEERARFLIQEKFPSRRVDAVWVGASGTGAVGKSGAMALVLCAVGEGYVGRQIPWALAMKSGFRDGEICIDLTDIKAPPAVISLPTWSPNDRVAA